MMTHRFLPLVVSLGFPLHAAAADWPQWRGPGRDGVAPDARLPAVWPEKLRVVWRAPAGPGYSTPVVAGGRVFITERRGGDEVVRALEADTGKEVWSLPYHAPYEVHPYAARHGDCPKATAAVSGGRVFTLGISGILCAADAASGKPLWKRDLGTEFASSPLFGVAASPLVADGLVILPVGHREGGGGMMAFREATGETAWKSVRDGPSYGSAIAADLGGIRQAIGFTAKHLVGVAIAGGKELWSYPLELPFDETCVTPVVWKGLVVLAGRNDAGTRLLRIRPSEGRLAVDEVWRQKAPIYFSSPVVRGDILFGVEHLTGRLFCLRFADGAVAWREGSFGDYASLVLAGDRLLVLDSKGKLTVVEATDAAYRPVATIAVSDGETYAHLVVVGNRLLVRDRRSVTALEP